MAKLTKPANQFQKPKDIMSWTIRSISNNPNKAFFSVKTKEVYLMKTMLSIPEHIWERSENFWVYQTNPHKYYTDVGAQGFKTHPMINYPELKTWRLLHNL